MNLTRPLISLAFLFLFLCNSCISVECNGQTTNKTVENKNVTKVDSTTKQDNKIATSNFKIVVLQTEDASFKDPDDKGEEVHHKYAKSMSIDSVDNLADQLAIYGAAYSLWPGPTGWTGKGILYTTGDYL